MTKLTDVLDITKLQEDIDAGYIREQFHPAFPYAILNYTEKAQYDNHWTEATLNCRGLIYNYETAEVIARPFPKFFNYSQLTDPPGPETPLRSVSDKMDGSLGIIYHAPDGSPHVATRGSFTSEQALWATNWIQEHNVYRGRDYDLTTTLVEILYPQNRIVLDYQGYEGLTLLGGVGKVSGTIYPPDVMSPRFWLGDVTETFDYSNLQDVLNAPDRTNAEGLVALTYHNQLIKFKQEDYIKLHRILTGLTERTVYDVLKQEGNVDRLIEIVPDEFHDWLTDVEESLLTRRNLLILHWLDLYDSIVEQLPEGYTQKDFALEAVKHQDKSALFLIHKSDHERVQELAWKLIEPPATKATVPSSSPL